MGVSTDGILAYGVDLEEDFELPEKIQVDEDGDGFWYEPEVEKVLKKLGLEHELHCSGEYPISYICVKGTNIVASTRYPKEIDFSELEKKVPANAKEKFKELGAFLEQELPKPGWLLLSMWW
jgi:hypothetical protein